MDLQTDWNHTMLCIYYLPPRAPTEYLNMVGILPKLCYRDGADELYSAL